MTSLVEICSPSPKKKREKDDIEEEEDIEKDIEKNLEKYIDMYADFDSSLEPTQENWYKRLPSGVSKDPAVWERYFKSIKKSFGYEVTDFPGSCFEAYILPQFDLLNPEYSECAGWAIDYYNNIHKTSYQFKELKAVNMKLVCGCYMYYLTFIAADEKLGEETFWGRVRGHEVKHCSIKPQVPQECSEITL